MSKNHAKINLFNNCLYLEDNNSKFGTFVQIRSKIILLPNKPYAFQLNNSVFKFQVSKTFLGLLICSCKKEKYKDYNEYIENYIILAEEEVVSCDIQELFTEEEKIEYVETVINIEKEINKFEIKENSNANLLESVNKSIENGDQIKDTFTYFLNINKHSHESNTNKNRNSVSYINNLLSPLYDDFKKRFLNSFPKRKTKNEGKIQNKQMMENEECKNNENYDTTIQRNNFFH